jgi:hypothetical protein
VPTITKSWTDQTQIIGSGGEWITLSGTTETFSSGVDLETNGYEGAHVIVEVDFDESPTDDVEVALYASLDGSNWDDTALTKLRVSRETDPNQISLVVRDVPHFRLGVEQTGSTDSHNVRAYYEAWCWNSA